MNSTTSALILLPNITSTFFAKTTIVSPTTSFITETIVTRIIVQSHPPTFKKAVHSDEPSTTSYSSAVPISTSTPSQEPSSPSPLVPTALIIASLFTIFCVIGVFVYKYKKRPKQEEEPKIESLVTTFSSMDSIKHDILLPKLDLDKRLSVSTESLSLDKYTL